MTKLIYTLAILGFIGQMAQANPPSPSLAIQDNHPKIISLLKKAADTSDILILTEKQKAFHQRLMKAIGEGDLKRVKSQLDLLESEEKWPPEVNGRNAEGETPLTLAIRQEQTLALKLVDLLLKYGANINRTHERGITPLNLATAGGKLELIKYLIEHGADINIKHQTFDTTPVIMMAMSGQTEMVKYMLKRGVDVDQGLVAAAMLNETALVQEQVKKGASTTAKNQALNRALIHKNKDLCRFLLGQGTTSQSDNIHAAILLGDLSLLKSQIQKGVDITAHDMFAIHYAASYGQLEILKFLVQNNLAIEARDHSENTPLLLASMFGHLKVVRYLLEQGADIHAQNKFGNSALLFAVHSENNFELVQYLLKHGVKIQTSNQNGDTALHLACEYEQPELIRLLLNAGAPVNLQNQAGFTPLMTAVSYEFVETITLLLQKGADPSLKNTDGQTALDLANELENPEIIKIIKAL